MSKYTALPACLPPPVKDFQILNKEVLAIGFGKTETSEMSPELLEVNLTVCIWCKIDFYIIFDCSFHEDLIENM